MSNKNSTPFIWQEILLSSSKIERALNLTFVTTTVEIYENLEKPYLTGLIEFVDASNIYADINFDGSEKIKFTFKSASDQAKPFSKTFYVSKVLTVSRANSNSQSIVLHLIEDIAYIANLQNVNRSYVGTTTEIISKIASNFLQKDILVSNTDTNTIKTIIPNLDPVDAMLWLRNDATTTDGYPFYLYSTLVGNELIYADLESMLTSEVINKDAPYVYDQSILSYPLEQTRIKKIVAFDLRNSEDLYSIIRKGLVGSNYEVIDLLNGNKINVGFDVVKDVFIKLADKLNKEQNNINYYPGNKIELDTRADIDGKFFSQLNSINITQIGTSQVFNNGSTYLPAYGEKQNSFEYKRHIISRALQEFLRKAPLQFTVEGYDFLGGEKSYTLGNVIRAIFNTSDADDVRPYDNKISGDYLIYEAHHIMKKERYDVKFTGVKLANFKL